MRDLQDVTRLSITDFRSISGTISVPLDAPIILIHGPNGTGKTSVLSALELALTGSVRAMKEDDANFARHVVHEGAQRAKVGIEGSQGPADDRGSFVIENGRIAGTPYLDGSDGQFFSERCYLAQSMLGRLLDIYQKSKVADGESALTQFVKDLLGLNQLDALIDGLPMQEIRDGRKISYRSIGRSKVGSNEQTRRLPCSMPNLRRRINLAQNSLEKFKRL